MKELDEPIDNGNGFESSLQESLGEFTFGEYKRFQQAVVGILNEVHGTAAIFTKPSSIARSAYDLLQAGRTVPKDIAEQYYTDVPNPFDIDELSEEQYKRLEATFGPDLARAKMVSQTVVEELERGKLLPVGGACLLETWALDILKLPLLKDQPKLQAQIAEDILAQGPYYTQITGAMLLGGENHVGIMYREEFPWWMRAKEYGVKNSRVKARQAYDDIFAAVERRARLIDPEFQLIGIHFDDMNLEKGGYLQPWMQKAFASLPTGFREFTPDAYDPDGYVSSWVRYTYSGPEMLDIVKRLARQQGVDLDEFSLHTRTKQLDHFHEPTFLLKSSVSLSIDEESRLKEYPEIAKLAVDRLTLKTHTQGNGFVGFHDLTNGSDIVHQTMKVGSESKGIKNLEDVASTLASPVRLSSTNIGEHLQYLQTIIFSLTQEGAITVASARAKKRLNEQQQELEKKRQLLQAQGLLQQLLENIDNVRRSDGISFVELPDDVPVDFVVESIQTLRKTKKLQRFFQKHQIKDETQKDFLGSLVASFDRGKKTIITVTLPGTFVPEDQEELRSALLSAITEKKEGTQDLVTTKEAFFASRSNEFASQFGMIDTSPVESLIDIIPDTFPIGKNPLVTHAIQLSFDPDMRQFIIDAQELEKSMLPNDQKRQLLLKATQQIFPKIAAYLAFIMEGGPYPITRFQRTYESVL